jgi:hypothetical protein
MTSPHRTLIAIEAAVLVLGLWSFTRALIVPLQSPNSLDDIAYGRLAIGLIGILLGVEVVLLRSMHKLSPTAGGILGTRAIFYPVAAWAFAWPLVYQLLTPVLLVQAAMYILIVRQSGLDGRRGISDVRGGLSDNHHSPPK